MSYTKRNLVTSKTSSSINNVITKEDKKNYVKYYKSHIILFANNVSGYIAYFLKDMESDKLKVLFKNMKKELRNSKLPDRKERKKNLKICNLYEFMLEDNGINKFSSYRNDNEYAYQFPFDPKILFRLGEPHLQCAAYGTTDDLRTQAGPKIDIIILHKIHRFAISICEVSGPNYKTNKNHFLGDRSKLARNMRAILHYIEQTSSTPNIEALNKIKLYSFQVYLNTFYIYSLSYIGNGYTAFVQKGSMSIPVSLSLLKNQLPAFLGRLWNVNTLMKEMIINIDHFINIGKEIFSNPSPLPSSQDSSSNKRQKYL